MTKKPFLVLYDYGQGGVWAYVKAVSKDDILRRLPELQVFDAPPASLSETDVARIVERSTYDIDRPAGLLAELIAQRKGSPTVTD